jgi:hypothetical protein
VCALRSVQHQVNFICPRQAANTTLQIRTFEMNIQSRQMRHKFVQKILCEDGSGYFQWSAVVAVFKKLLFAIVSLVVREINYLNSQQLCERPALSHDSF